MNTDQLAVIDQLVASLEPRERLFYEGMNPNERAVYLQMVAVNQRAMQGVQRQYSEPRRFYRLDPLDEQTSWRYALHPVTVADDSPYDWK